MTTTFYIRLARAEDAVSVQELRKLGWQDNYVSPETGVTANLLKEDLASLPVPQSDIDHYIAMLHNDSNKEFNLVAELDGAIVGVVFLIYYLMVVEILGYS